MRRFGGTIGIGGTIWSWRKNKNWGEESGFGEME